MTAMNPKFKRAIRHLLLRMRFLQNLQYHQVDWDKENVREERDSEINEIQDAINVLDKEKEAR